MNVLVTGGTGFVGTAFVAHALEKGWRVRCALRRPEDRPPSRCEGVFVGEINERTDWRTALKDCEAVVHLAARVHVMDEKAADPLAAFRATNTQGTIALARQALEAGVRRFVFVSSIKVNGEGRAAPYTPADPPAPEEPYALSKAEAEAALLALTTGTPMALTILRPPLVYGPGVGANFRALAQAVKRGLPLPLGLVRNRRSLLYIGNLVSAIGVCLSRANTAGKIFLLSDGRDVSTPELICLMAAAMGRSARLLPVPTGLLKLTATLFGKRKALSRLLGSLCLQDDTLTQATGWRPPYSLEEGLRQTLSPLPPPELLR